MTTGLRTETADAATADRHRFTLIMHASVFICVHLWFVPLTVSSLSTHHSALFLRRG
jgi:hypothetical protein